MPVPSNLVQRDQGNAEKASGIAGEHRFEQSAIQVGAFQVNPRSMRYSEMRRKSMEAIFHNPFDVMVEVEVEFRNGEEKSFVWYGNERVEVHIAIKSWWGRLGSEFPDLNEITSFSVLIKEGSGEPMEQPADLR